MESYRVRESVESYMEGYTPCSLLLAMYLLSNFYKQQQNKNTNPGHSVNMVPGSVPKLALCVALCREIHSQRPIFATIA